MSKREDVRSGLSRRTFLGGGAAGVTAALVGIPGLYENASGHVLFRDENDRSRPTPANIRDALAASGNGIVQPQAINSVRGNVTNAAALINGGTATLMAGGSGPNPMVILDYGTITGGRPLFTITNVRGDVNLQAIYSQSLPNLLPAGDGYGTTTDAAEKMMSFCGSASGSNLSRLENYYPTSGDKGVVSGRLLQGGQRFEAVQLLGNGSVELGVVGFLPSVRMDDPSDPGSFHCSDATLDKIWELGAHTANVCAAPVGSVPGYYEATRNGLLVFGCWYGGYWPGAGWADYTASFTVAIVENEAAWVVRGTLEEQGIEIELCASNDTLGSVLNPPADTANTLRIWNISNSALIAQVQLPFTVKPRVPYDVVTAVTGGTLTVSINGTQVYSGTPAGMSSSGWFGFVNQQGALSLARDLTITNGTGTLLQESLRGSKAQAFIEACCAGTNRLPSIMDGALRDRMTWIGDVGITTKTFLATSFDNQYLRGNAEVVGKYQGANGGVPSAVPAQANGPALTGPSAGTARFTGGTGASDYVTMYITESYDYWFYSGDTVWLSAQWSVLRGAMNLMASSLQSNSLARSSSVGGPFGSQLSNSAHIYGALTAATEMAKAVGDAASAASYSALAPRVANAINTLLWNPSVGLYQAQTSSPAVFDQQGSGLAFIYGIPLLQGGPGLGALKTSELDTLLQGVGSAYIGPVAASTSAKSGDISPYLTGWEILGRLAVGDASGSLAIIRSVWGAMLESNPYYSGGCFEYINQDTTPALGPGTSLAHAWSSGATPALSNYILGGRPLTAGFTTFLVEPQTGRAGSTVFPTTPLNWCSGTVPTPHGTIAINWLTEANGATGFTLNLTVPKQTRAYVGVPTAASQATVDGTLTAPDTVPAYAGLPGYLYFGPLSPGSHQILATQPS